MFFANSGMTLIHTNKLLAESVLVLFESLVFTVCPNNESYVNVVKPT